MNPSDRSFAIANPTLERLIAELGSECSRVLGLIYQLQLSNLQEAQKIEILSELLSSSIHLQAHCSEDFQTAIAQELEDLPDAD